MYRKKLLLAAGLTIGLGLGSRLFPLGFFLWDKYLGDGLYAVIFYLALSWFWPAGSIPAKMILIAIYTVAIEFFQLTPIPLRLNHSDFFPIRVFAYLVLGSGFSGWDLLAYGVGIVGVAGWDRWYLKK